MSCHPAFGWCWLPPSPTSHPRTKNLQWLSKSSLSRDGSSHTICTPYVVLRTTLTVPGPLHIRNVTLHACIMFRPTYLFAACLSPTEIFPAMDTTETQNLAWNALPEFGMDRPAGFDTNSCLLQGGRDVKRVRPATSKQPSNSGRQESGRFTPLRFGDGQGGVFWGGHGSSKIRN